jgi:transposase
MRLTLAPRTRQVIERNIMIAKHLKDIRLLLRLQSILLWADGEEIENIANICITTERTIYNWRNLFIFKRVDGLRYRKSSGRKNKLNKSQKKELKELILAGPENNGYKTGVWTCAIIQELIFKKFGVEYSIGYVSQLLNSMGLSHKKPDRVSHKADKVAQAEWENERFPELSQKAIKEGATILFQDESTFMLWTGAAYSWGERGKKLFASINMSNAVKKVFGAIELTTGKMIYQFTERANSTTFLKYLKYIVTRNKGRKVYLVIDNGPAHKSAAITKYLEANNDQIELVRLPTYSPILNPIEKVWKLLKQKDMHNRYFKNKAAFLTTLRYGLMKIQDSPEQVQSVMKKWNNIYNRVKSSIEMKIERWNYVKALVA